MKRLFLETQVRGTDATGLAYIGQNNGRLEIIKSPEAAKEFVKKDEVEAVFANMPDIIIGHNRKKTVGDPDDNKNNHPLFSRESGLALIHNGAVPNHSKWRNTLEDGSQPFIYKPFDADVDSEAILRLIETFLYIPRTETLGVDPEMVFNTPKDQWFRGLVSTEMAIQDAVNNLPGGEACALLDEANPNTIYLWTTSNPMVLYFIPEHNIIAFASTPEIANKAFSDVEVDYEWYHDFFYREIVLNDHSVKDKIEYKLATNELIKISLSFNERGSNVFEIEKFKLTPDKAASKPIDCSKFRGDEEEHQVPFISTEEKTITVKDN